MKEDDKEHECKYCGSMNTGSDEDCYRAPASEKERQEDAKEMIEMMEVVDKTFRIPGRWEVIEQTLTSMQEEARKIKSEKGDFRVLIPRLNTLLKEAEELHNANPVSFQAKCGSGDLIEFLKLTILGISLQPFGEAKKNKKHV